ncbi:hypothetical protein [Streptomyces boncukensis]|uniref:hypothetical protein n=1 Tax=Streptomyces boncukensis TaxID=2711219 RepID=UPI0030B9B207
MNAFLREAERLGVDASLSVRQLRRWERESPPPLPHPGQQTVLEAMFGVPLAEMGFAVPGHRVTDDARVRHAEAVKRRTFVVDAGALAAGTALATERGHRIGARDVDQFRTQLSSLYRTDHTAGSAPAQTRADRMESALTRVLSTGTYTTRVGRDLHAMLSELYSLQAWFGYDGAPVEKARRSAVEALTSAQLTGDPLLHVSALETFILLSVKADRAWEAASAVEYAYSLADAAHAGATVRLVIALREANVATHTGDLAAVRRALSRGVSYLGRMDCDTDVPGWARFAGVGEVDYATASMYLRARQPQRAVPFLRSAVSELGSGYSRNTAWYRAKLAGVLLQAGEDEEACAEMGAVLDTCDGITSNRLARRMRTFAHQAERVRTPAARDCAERIHETVATTAGSGKV